MDDYLTLFKCLYKKENYLKLKDILSSELFEGIQKNVYELISYAHEKYDVELNSKLLVDLYKSKFPASTTATKNAVAIFLDNIQHTDIPDDAIYIDIIRDLRYQEYARQIATIAVDVANGESKDLTKVKELLERAENYDLNDDVSLREVDFDLDKFLEDSDPKNLHSFRLSTLQEQVPGIGPGNLGIVFARPEVGKSAFMCYEVAGLLQSGKRVLYCENEEPAYRDYIRIICSMFSRTQLELSLEKEEIKRLFNPLKANLKLVDCIGTDIRTVNKLASSFEPDVIVLNQLDKFHIDGDFSREDIKLGNLYGAARELSKRFNTAVWAVTQCSAEGEGLANIDYSMMAGSKTSKAAEADLIIGIGANKEVHQGENYRQFNVCKNKINGWKGYVVSMIDPLRCVYNA